MNQNKLQIDVICDNGYYEESHRFFIPVDRVIEWCDAKYGVRKLNKSVEVSAVAFIDANHAPIETDPDDTEPVPVAKAQSESEASFLAAMRDMGYDEDLDHCETGLFDKEDFDFLSDTDTVDVERGCD